MKRFGEKKQKHRIVLSTLLAFVMMFTILPVHTLAADGPVITEQPKDVEVNYPDGATFHVGVAEPDKVASWQWIASDGYSEFTLSGKSATTDTLVIPSTMQDDPDMFYACIITDKDGNTTQSDPCHLHIKNMEEDLAVLYVGDYAVQPGEKLDLADTTLGTGTVEFASDGVNMTFTDLKLDNTVMTYGVELTPAFGLFLVRRNPDHQEYYMHFKGECVINNTFFDEKYNAGGVTVNSFFATRDDPNAPTVIIDGDGKLTVKGGSNQIYSDANLEIAMDVKTGVNGKYFNDGISGKSVYIDEGVKLDLTVNGTAIHADNDLYIYDGADIKIASSTPHVSVGPTTKNMVFVGGSVYAKKAILAIKGYADPENFIPYGSFVAVMSGIILAGEGSLNADGTDISIEMDAGKSDEPFAMNFSGISGAGDTNSVSLTNGAKVGVKIHTPEVTDTVGIFVSGIVEAEKDSSISVDISSKGEVIGIEADRAFRVTDSDVEALVESTTNDNTFGIVCGDAEIALDKEGTAVYASAKGGVAMAASTGEEAEEGEEIKYVAGYTPKKILLKGNTALVMPEEGTISLSGMPAYATTIKAETFYGSDTSKPAAEVRLASSNSHDCPAKQYTDVDTTQWYHEAIDYVLEKGLMKGTSATTFKPDTPVSRAMLVTILYRLEGEPAVGPDIAFADIRRGQWYTDAVVWGYANNIVKGYGEVRGSLIFSPDSPITREEFATILYRYAQYKEYDVSVGEDTNILSYDDAFDIHTWAMPAMQWACGAQLINGRSASTLVPRGGTKRSEGAAILMRFIETDR